MNYSALSATFEEGYAEATRDGAEVCRASGLPEEACAMLETLEKARKALTESAWWKARESKSALVALLNDRRTRASEHLWQLWQDLYALGLEVLSPPRHLSLVTTQGPHAPPVISAYRRGLALLNNERAGGLRGSPHRDTTKHT